VRQDVLVFRWEVMSALADQRVLGIVRARSADEAVELSRRLLAAGLRCVEVAFTTPDAARALRAVTAEAPSHAVIGAGTVLSAVDAAAAVEAGARFLVAPDLSEEVVAAAHHHGVPVMPGVGSVTELRRALRLGADAAKLFPAARFGPEWLKDVRAALPNVPVVPTGGVTAESVPDWLAAGAVACGLGSWLTGGDDATASGRVRQVLAAAGTA
jgi:2-dehydro-3-deoxyphosphogluconate aldolase/(4S)-4-hydroxy-2-oxoglutarate aldolase